MKKDQDISVAIIEDDETIRDGYAFLIGNTAGYKIAGTYPSCEDALKKIAHDEPDVLLLDVELPGMSGIEALPKQLFRLCRSGLEPSPRDLVEQALLASQPV